MTDHETLRAELHAAIAERDSLRQENIQLRQLLAGNQASEENGLPGADRVKPEITPTGPASIPTPEDKIKLFRSLFRGREDVYAIRWEGRNGKSGYSPARRLRPQGATSNPTNINPADLLPLTDSVIRAHLTGKTTIGIYPLLTDERCCLLVADFDKATWRDDVTAFLRTCGALNVPAILERSRSGNGAHVWIFFEQPISASVARKLGCFILTQTLAKRHMVGLDSYDRFFPSQDTMPKGGFGNLIALPLQGLSRKEGNSIFLDDRFEPYPDQWATLSTIRKVKTNEVGRIVGEAIRHGQVIGMTGYEAGDGFADSPWTIAPSRATATNQISGPFPERVQIVLANLIFVEKANLSSSLLNRLTRLSAFQNPEFYKAQAMRRSTFDKPRIICCAEEFPQHIALPRGCLKAIVELLTSCNIKIDLRDERVSGDAIEFRFKGKLHREQEVAARVALEHTEGMICAPPAFGKTVVGAWLIAERKVSTLVLVHRKPLLDQWRAQLASFLGSPLNEIGQIGGARNSRTGKIDVAMIQTLNRAGVVKDLVAEYGQVIVDECHHVSAVSFEQVLRNVRARFVLGVTATPIRRDGHHPIIAMQCGPVRYQKPESQSRGSRPQRELRVRATGFASPTTLEEQNIQEIYSALVGDEARNQLILRDLMECLRKGSCPLLLTDRREHLDWFANNLRAASDLDESIPPLKVLKLHGGMNKRQLSAMADSLAEAQNGTLLAILATGRYIGEGFDVARLDTLFLAAPFSWRGTLQQYVGRLHRISPNKEVVRVFDYLDPQVGVLMAMFKKRLAGYKALGYTQSADVNAQAESTSLMPLWK